MKRAIRQIIVSAIALFAICVVCRYAFFREHETLLPLPYGKEAVDTANLRFVYEPEGVVEVIGAVKDGDYLRLTIRPVARGKTFVTVQDAEGGSIGISLFHVSSFKTVYDRNNGGFSGDSVAMASNAVFCLLECAIMAWNFFKAKGSAFYSYKTIYFAGFSIFALVTGITLTRVCIAHILHPGEYITDFAFRAMCSASSRFMLLTAPLVVAFATALAVSNIALLKHERPSLQNLLGIALCIAMLAGEALGVFIKSRDLSGSEYEVRIIEILQNIYATIYVYFECMLAGSVICALRATKLTPAQGKDYIIILGCAFRQDGSLPPLLKGRVDRALAFWNEQKDAQAGKAVFIPSGGKGADESMSEAEAMKRYLMANGISEKSIITEDKSANTYENMLFSKRIIDENAPGAGAVFATTNYHLFRSGVWANRAGLNAEGIGSRTRWWYWPNAFVRECLGLLRYQWREELALLITIILFFVAMSVALL